MTPLKVLTLMLLLGLVFSLPGQVSAHLAGQPPFFKINDIFSNLYPVPTVSSPDFNLPQDLASETYLVNQALEFAIDDKFLPVPADVVKDSKFGWEFGDGQKGSGMTNKHTYSKQGSYILTITAQASVDPQPTLIQSVMIHILPDKNYQLPTPIIEVNNQTILDPLTDILEANFSQEVFFNGQKSKNGSGKIVSYLWDLGDTISAQGSSLTHRYDDSLSQVFPVLRVRDENGFISDSFLEIKNNPQALTKAKNQTDQKWIYILAGIVSILLAVGAIRWLRKNF